MQVCSPVLVLGASSSSSNITTWDAMAAGLARGQSLQQRSPEDMRLQQLQQTGRTLMGRNVGL